MLAEHEPNLNIRAARVGEGGPRPSRCVGEGTVVGTTGWRYGARARYELNTHTHTPPFYGKRLGQIAERAQAQPGHRRAMQSAHTCTLGVVGERKLGAMAATLLLSARACCCLRMMPELRLLRCWPWLLSICVRRPCERAGPMRRCLLFRVACA